MAAMWISWLLTLSCILTVHSLTSNITVTEFCSCWSVQSTTVQGNNCAVMLDFGNCWLTSNTTVSPGDDVISDTDLVQFGLTISSSVSQIRNCSVDNVCSLAFGIGSFDVGKTYTATIRPQCDTCSICSDKVTEFYKAVPTTTTAPTTTKKYKPLQHKYLFPTLVIGFVVCVIVAFIYVIRRWRQRIHHARKERAAAAASFANIQAEAENNNTRGDNRGPPPQYGSNEQYNGGAHFLSISEKHGIVNDGFDDNNW
ncbi:uncharacterized protein LOC132545221 [Ylistrum balloti]|uniref:uncharacterized protein LOC132545221 n=1 Tax=Ylistrum balloti TaxID=509963 RepID=UPI002905DE8C|nr:uncharacterized protein LOC132545221 [Ylistrum balloti]